MSKEVLKRLLGDRGTALVRRMRTDFQDIRDIPVARGEWRRVQASQAFPAPVRQTDRPHVLFVTEKWCDANPDFGLSNNTHNLFGSLEASGLATQAHFHFDEYWSRYGQPCDGALMQVCMEERPDVLFLTWLPFSRFNPKLETLRIIRRMGIPIVTWWGDTVNPPIMEMADRLAAFVEHNVVVDSSTAYLRSKWRDRYLHLATPQDSRVFYNPGLDRDIGISFLGSTARGDYSDRRAGLDALRAHGIAVYQSGGQREHRLSIEDYARIYMRSRIALNFSLASTGPQVKGHVFEVTLCGAMLLESDNPETRRWFEPMVEYVPFAGEADLVEKARYYLEHHAERTAIAERGHQKARERYTGEKFWETLFARLFTR